MVVSSSIDVYGCEEIGTQNRKIVLKGNLVSVILRIETTIFHSRYFMAWPRQLFSFLCICHYETHIRRNLCASIHASYTLVAISRIILEGFWNYCIQKKKLRKDANYDSNNIGCHRITLHLYIKPKVFFED